MTIEEWWATYDDLTGIDIETAEAAWNAGRAEGVAAERERCLKIAMKLHDEKWSAYKTGRGPDRANPHTEGQADAAAHIAHEIENPS